MRELLSGHYITHKKSLLITGPKGCGESWIANALGEQACRLAIGQAAGDAGAGSR